MSLLVNAVTERQLMDTIVRMAHLLGWETYHTYDSRRSEPGFPDIVAVHPAHGVVWMELKTQRGRVSRHQRYWIDLLQRARQRVYLVRPADMDRVEAILRGETS